jgi:hypothetical protein
MKTRYEMVYEGMIALASNPNLCKQDLQDFSVNTHISNQNTADRVAQLACALADSYINDGYTNDGE